LLLDVAPGTRFPAHHHGGDEECYVISGSLVACDAASARGISITPTAAAITVNCGPMSGAAFCSSCRPKTTCRRRPADAREYSLHLTRASLNH
jgi:hypothetical protein